MIILESGIQITFPDNAKIVKFDETEFYRKSFNPLPRAKGVDVIVDESDHIVFLEIKNCTARESENRWRIGHDDTKRNTVPNGLDISGRNSFDIEMAEKVAMTLACLVGAYTYGESKPQCNELLPLSKALIDKRVFLQKKPILIYLLLDGCFGSQTRSEKTVRRGIQNSIKAKLQWLNCHVIVSSSSDFHLYHLEIS